MSTSQVFTADCHGRFATLSGDFNPVHMDEVIARRTQAGSPVVHGIHTLLWLLDSIAAQRTLPAATGVKARFRQMVYVGDRVDAEILELTAVRLRGRALVDGVEVVSFSVSFQPVARKPPPLTGAGVVRSPAPSTPAHLSLAQMEGLTGRLDFAATPDGCAAQFPHAAKYLGTQRVAALATCSCLVGMVVPGLHSLFGAVDLTVTEEDPDRTDELAYAVMSVDERFRLVRIAIRGGGLKGSLETISRSPPVAQPRMSLIAPLVDSTEFKGTTALVVGGSRGLGEVTAKMLAAGGGHVTVTYKSGRTDADAVAAEIKAAGGNCDTLAYDAGQSAAPQLAALRETPTHVYYFATPLIYRRKTGLFDPRRLEDFNLIYLSGFLDLVQACLHARPQGITVFYPSTVYVETRPAEMTEYAMSKAAGEILCADMQATLAGVRLLVRRLPRLHTDQTNSLIPVDLPDTLATMLPIVRDMQRLGTAPQRP